VAWDDRRLDTPELLVAFLVEIEASRSTAAAGRDRVAAGVFVDFLKLNVLVNTALDDAASPHPAGMVSVSQQFESHARRHGNCRRSDRDSCNLESEAVRSPRSSRSASASCAKARIRTSRVL
jgi:hypothetical protein